jgi:hypothetical protein
MDLEQYDRPQDGISFMEKALAVFFGALALLAAALLLPKLPNWDEARDAQVTAAHVSEAAAKKELRPCDFVIVQYGAYHETRHPECVSGTRELPNHILTMPVRK